MSIYIVKLANGQEIAGTYRDSLDDLYIIEDPLLVENRYDPLTNTRLMVLSRYNSFSRELNVGIPSKQVVAIYPVNESFEKYYYNSLMHMVKVRDKMILEDLDKTAQHIENILIAMDHPSDEANFVGSIHETDKEDDELLLDMAGMYLSGNTVH